MISYGEMLAIAANWAAILTAIVAVWAFGHYTVTRCKKLSRLESYLKAEKAKGSNKGQRSVLHLVANLRMSEDDVLDAAFRSKHVRCATDPDDEGFVARLLFEYVDE